MYKQIENATQNISSGSTSGCNNIIPYDILYECLICANIEKQQFYKMLKEESTKIDIHVDDLWEKS